MGVARFIGKASKLPDLIKLRTKAATGEEGERRAAAYLQKMGYRILQKNFRCRDGEIDIVARDGITLVFIEVKARDIRGNERPEAAVTLSKKHKLCKAARYFMQKYKLTDTLFRFDIIGFDTNNSSEWKLLHWQNVIDYKQALKRRH
jgi:putative endonuclease